MKINATLFICCKQVYARHTDGNAREFHSAVASQFMQNCSSNFPVASQLFSRYKYIDFSYAAVRLVIFFTSLYCF